MDFGNIYFFIGVIKAIVGEVGICLLVLGFLGFVLIVVVELFVIGGKFKG